MFTKWFGLAVVSLAAGMLTACGGGGGSGTATATTQSQSLVLTVTPSSAAVPIGTKTVLTASIGGTSNTVVTWSISPSGVGTLTPSGLAATYTAPGTMPQPNVTITVTSNADPTKKANAAVTIVYPNNTSTNQSLPVLLGTSGGNSTDFTTTTTTITCCSGTLGALVDRAGTLYILSNNHVLDKSGHGTVGDPVTQPGLVDDNCGQNPSNLVANLSQAATLGSSNVDAAIAQIVTGAVDTNGTILDLGATAGSTSISNAPPSSALGTPGVNEAVAKVGRTTGLTCSTINSISTSVSVTYSSQCGNGGTNTTISYTNQIDISGASFSNAGDSGSLVVDKNTARPVGLLFAGSSTDTVANPISQVLNALQDASHNVPTIVGGSDHAVSCASTATAQSASFSTGAQSLTAEQVARVVGVKQRFGPQLLADPRVAGLDVGASLDDPRQPALLVYATALGVQVPHQLDGVRTRVVYATTFTKTMQPLAPLSPVLTAASVSDAIARKEKIVDALMQRPGIHGVGVGASKDDPAAPALVVYVSPAQHASVPAEINGLRTRIVDNDGFRAFGWGNMPEPVRHACVAPKKKL
jgi:hypothetical protein